MLKYKNITLLGTSHIARQSLEEIREAIAETKPDIVALELDKQRLYALLNRHKERSRLDISMAWKIGLKGYLFSLLASWVEEKLGRSVGVMPGDDMLTAFREAKRNRIEVALIDQEIEITLKRLSKAISWREKWNFFSDLFRGLVLQKSDVGVRSFDLGRVPEKELINLLLLRVKKRYPNLYRVLVTERNYFMGRRLSIMMKQHENKRILAVVGAGHEEEMLAIIKKKMRSIDVVAS